MAISPDRSSLAREPAAFTASDSHSHERSNTNGSNGSNFSTISKALAAHARPGDDNGNKVLDLHSERFTPSPSYRYAHDTLSQLPSLQAAYTPSKAPAVEAAHFEQRSTQQRNQIDQQQEGQQSLQHPYLSQQEPQPQQNLARVPPQGEQDMFKFIKELEKEFVAQQGNNAAQPFRLPLPRQEYSPPTQTTGSTPLPQMMAHSPQYLVDHQQLERSSHQQQLQYAESVLPFDHPQQQQPSSALLSSAHPVGLFPSPSVRQGGGNEADTGWWQVMQQGQAQHIDNPYPDGRDRQQIQYPDYADEQASLRAWQWSMADDRDEEDQVALDCLRRLERLRPDQAIRVLDSVAHLIGGDGIYRPSVWGSPHDHRSAGVMVQQHVPRTSYDSLPGSLVPFRTQQQHSTASPPLGRGSSSAAPYAAISTSGAQAGSANRPRPATRESSTRAAVACTPLKRASDPRPTTGSASAGPSSSRGPASSSLHAPCGPSVKAAQGSSSTDKLDKTRDPSTVPIFFSAKATDTPTPSGSHRSESRGNTPASASTSATSVATTAAKASSVDREMDSSFEGPKVTSAAPFTWQGVLSDAEIGDLEEHYGGVILCPGFTTGFAKIIDAENKVVIPGATQGFKVALKRLERYLEKSQDTKFAWWIDVLKDKSQSVEPITVSDVLGGLQLDVWEEYRRTYKAHVARRASRSPTTSRRKSSVKDAGPSKRKKVAGSPGDESDEDAVTPEREMKTEEGTSVAGQASAPKQGPDAEPGPGPGASQVGVGKASS